ncbi:MAG: hypothetical protein PHY92_04385 [Alphaproteobacteria bacterium]|nr:hypothetical protein [Alphaproteobacteria bacterium]
MAKDTPSKVLADILSKLEPLSSEDRGRIMQAAFRFFAEKPEAVVKDHIVENIEVGEVGALPSQAQSWMKKNGLTAENIQQVFLIKGEDVEVIASKISGKNTQIKTLNCYLLAGLARLFSKGERSFEDKSARKLCEHFGCYDSTNHSKYMKEKGNVISGSKSKGWTLTGPGLVKGAELVKGLSQ